MIYFIIIISLTYIIYTLNFTLKFNKTNIYFTKNQKTLQIILMWLIPFLWIVVIKTIVKPSPGSDNFIKKSEDPSIEQHGGGYRF